MITKKDLQEYREKVSLLKKFVHQSRADSLEVYLELEELNGKGFRINFNDIKNISRYCYIMKLNERPREGYLRLIGRIFLLKNLFSTANSILKKYTKNKELLKNSQVFRNQVDDVYSRIMKMHMMKRILTNQA